MRDLILVPTFKRTEYLELCLERLAAVKPSYAEVWVCHDNRPRMPFPREAFTLAERFGAQLCMLAPHWNLGNVTNFLESYKHAYDSPARYVYLVEDDVLVGNDFFKWHEAVQARGDYFCSVGWHDIRNPAFMPVEDPHALVESAVDFSSIGVCWKRENLAAVVAHAKTAYYSSLTGYMRKTFPDSPIPPHQWTEQAGLIMRVLLAGKGKRVVCWPSVPRCAHIGVHGYHRVNGPQLTVGELREALRTGEFAKYVTRPDVNTRVNETPWTPDALYVSQKF